MVVKSRRECSRWHVLVVHVLGWYWLPGKGELHLLYQIELNMLIHIACNYDHHSPLTHMHHNRIAGGVGSSRAGNSRGSPVGRARIGGAGRGGCHWRTSRVSRPPSEFVWMRKPRSISPSVCKCLTYALIIFDALSLGVDCNRCCILPCLFSLYHILVIPWYTELSKCLACLDRWKSGDFLSPASYRWLPRSCLAKCGIMVYNKVLKWIWDRTEAYRVLDCSDFRLYWLRTDRCCPSGHVERMPHI
jgi:hypothetical protein